MDGDADMNSIIDTAYMRALIDGGYQLIPLHGHLQTVRSRGSDGKTRQLGKAPRDKRWTTMHYDNESVLQRASASGWNVGVRLRACDLVLDIDPRSIQGGIPAAKRKLRTLGVRLRDYPAVATGSGGYHLYMWKPAGLAMLDHLPDGWKGIEFKTVGRQVVAPGSIHPNGTPYRWADTDFDPDDLWLGAPKAPNRLLKAGRRPKVRQRAGSGEGQGEHPAGEIATILRHLDAEDFREHDRWLNLMMAVHHASAGAACEEFVEWCEGDPLYAGDGEEIRYRWESLRRHGIGLGTLYKFMKEHGCAHLIERRARVVPVDEIEEVS